MLFSWRFLLILSCPILLLILVNWGDFFSGGDTKFMAVMLKGPWIWNKRWNIQICVQKLAKEGQNFYVQAINYQLPLDFQFSDIENTLKWKENENKFILFLTLFMMLMKYINFTGQLWKPYILLSGDRGFADENILIMLIISHKDVALMVLICLKPNTTYFQI